MPNSLLFILMFFLLSPPAFSLGGEGIVAPVGPVGEAERVLLMDSVAIMLAIIIPTIIATLAFAWWFRASNARARYLPDWSYSGRVELLVWSIPTLVVIFLGGVTWISSHQLDPAHPLSTKSRPLDIQVVSLDWKWLFIYPEQRIASINQLTVPAGVPLHFHITSATVFNVFFVPQLGSQIYAMNGMVTDLNLEADHEGTYHGLSAHFSGDGFSDMAFDLHAVPPAQFRDWVAQVREEGVALNDTEYHSLLKQSTHVKPYTYREVEAGLFGKIAMQVLPSGDGPETGQPSAEVSPRKED